MASVETQGLAWTNRACDPQCWVRQISGLKFVNFKTKGLQDTCQHSTSPVARPLILT